MENQSQLGKSRPLFMRFAPLESRIMGNQAPAMYDPASQETTVDWHAGNTTSCMQSTSGTEPKNEADAVMDD